MKVLLVEDSKPVKMMVEGMLKEEGCEVVWASNGEEALKEVETHGSFTFTLLDWNMPVLDGMGFLEKLAEKNLDIGPVVMMTTESAPEKIEKAISMGVKEYIMKPFDKDILFEKLRMAGIV